MFSTIVSRRRLLIAAASALFTLAPVLHAASTLLVWPVDPVIEHDERAAALWIENRGQEAAYLQLRVFAWRQADGDSVYDAQAEVAGSPPMFRVEPGQRQLVRLTRAGQAPVGTEQAYRVILDEIPPPAEAGQGDAPASVGLKFQMRYAIPLFVYGQGLWAKERPDRKRDPATAARPVLSWRTVVREGRTFLEIRNTGPVHARLTEVAFRQGTRSASVAEGLFGYVLAGSVAHWALAVDAHGELVAKVNGATATSVIPGPRPATP